MQTPFMYTQCSAVLAARMMKVITSAVMLVMKAEYACKAFAQGR